MDNRMLIAGDLDRLQSIRNAAQNIRMISGVSGVVMVPLDTIAGLLQFYIRLFDPDHTNEALHGAISYDQRIIHINGTKSILEQRFIIARQFGYILLHCEYQNEPGWVYDAQVQDRQSSSMEKEIDLFAAELLMPVDLVKQEIDYHDGRLALVAEDFHVSVDAIRSRRDFLMREAFLRSQLFFDSLSIPNGF